MPPDEAQQIGTEERARSIDWSQAEPRCQELACSGSLISRLISSPIVARVARHLGLLIEYRRWTHCAIESVANLRKRLADYTHSAHRLLAQARVLVDRFDKRLLAHGNQVPQ
jgi:hypothetical protein